MIFHVPQFIDIEDKIVGPLTWKQFGWLVLMSVIMLIFWKTLEFAYFIISSIPIAIICVAMAFYKPYGLTLIQLSYYTAVHLFSPKLYTWHRVPKMRKSTHSQVKRKDSDTHAAEVITLDELQNIADTLDNPEAHRGD